ncbi:MAG: hypothetical protein MR406_08155 [Blautia sp.]|nr:hypothetical protein [Blautia sp.]MDD7728129.1 hypothetical protein [Clostridia bacterium]MDY5663008.1 hypothetical protein [Blautia sp.]
MKRSFKEIFLRVIILMAGLTIAHFGVTLFLLANLGSDPYNVLVQGVYRTVSGMTGWAVLTHGRVHIALCFLIILVLLVVDRTYIKLGTVLCMIFGGPIIDVFTLLLNPLVSEDSALPYKIFILALGCVILAYGMTIVIKSDAGTGPNDLVAVVISDKTKKSFGIVRIVVDVVFVLVGFLLGGSVGIGTIICAGCVGPVANFFLPINEKVVQKILDK